MACTETYHWSFYLTRTTTWNLPVPSGTRDCINGPLTPLLWRLILMSFTIRDKKLLKSLQCYYSAIF